MFQNRVKRLRQERGLTQVEFAKAFGISKATIAMWEVGNRCPDLDTVSRIADFFGVTTDYLLCKSDSKNSKTPSEEDIKFALFEGAEGISDEAYLEVKRFAEFIKQKYQDKA